MQYRSITAAAALFITTACGEDGPAFEADPGPVTVEAAGSSAGAGGAGGVGGSVAAGSPAESPAGRGGAGGSSAGAGGAVGGSSAAAELPRAGGAGAGGAAAGSSAGAGGVGGSSAGGAKIRCVAGDYNMTCAAARLTHLSIMWAVPTGPGASITYNCNVEYEAPECVIGDTCTMLTSDGRTLTGTCARP
jgi:hypothetical protein